MAGDSSSEQEQPDDPDSEFAEVDPTGRFGRYREVLGKGAFKTVYKSFDELEGIEVAWNQVKVVDLLRNSDDLERLYSEVHLLKTLKHQNIIKFYSSWIDAKHHNINFITEIFTSGTLRQYRTKHKHVDIRALKNWSRQILRGLLYLHSLDPPVIHRDLKCDNIFVNGNQGEVKIGDLGLAAILHHAHPALSVIGTPEFMAPELYEEQYNELVDIYAFGMCLLELASFEYPYSECSNAVQIYKKVTSGIKPASLQKVKDPGVKEFIEKCIANVSERLPARDLLMDPFLQSDVSESIGRSVRASIHHSDDNCVQTDAKHLSVKEDMSMASRDFTVQGQRRDINTIFLKLHIIDSTGQPHNIHFPFDIEADTSISVASEMVAELDLTDQDVTAIATMIDSEIQSYVPEWMPGDPFGESYGNDETTSDNFSESKDDVSGLPEDPDHPSVSLILEQLPSGRKYWSDSPKGISGDSPACLSQSHLPSELNLDGNGHNSIDIDERQNSFVTNDKEQGHPHNCLCLPYQLKASQFLTDGLADTVDSSVSSGVPNTSPLDLVNEEANEVPVSTEYQSGDTQNEPVADHHAGDNTHLLTGDKKIVENEEEEDVKIFVEKMEHLDLEQQKELHSGGTRQEPVTGEHAGDNSYPLTDDKTSMENEQEDVKIIVEKLEHLILQHQKELRELKQKRDQAVVDILKALPPELHVRTLNMCRLKVPDFKMHGETDANAGHSVNAVSPVQQNALLSHFDNSPMDNLVEESLTVPTMEGFVQTKAAVNSTASSNSSTIIGKNEKREPILGLHVGGYVFWNRSNIPRVGTEFSGVGIAVILKDDLSKSKSEGEAT